VALMTSAPRRDTERWFGECFDQSFKPRIWRQFPAMRGFRETEGTYPLVDMQDKGNEIVVKAEIPGIEKEDINISVSNETVTIKGKIKKEKEVKGEDYLYSERSYGAFTRTLDLPTKVQEDKIKAKFENGVLEIHLPKDEESKPREIKVDVK
jgi:HSP20 family protein